jgi:hypothetical protein
MLELFFVFGALFLIGAFVLFLLKLVFSIILLPVKLALFLFKGVLGVIIAIPLAIVFLNVFSFAFPVVLVFLLLPILLGAAILAFIFRLVT